MESNLFKSLDGSHSYSPEQLEKAFSMVQNKDHWKNPIHAVIRKRDFTLVETAVVFYTGTVPEVVSETDTYCTISAIGYQAGPCGDH